MIGSVLRKPKAHKIAGSKLGGASIDVCDDDQDLFCEDDFECCPGAKVCCPDGTDCSIDGLSCIANVSIQNLHTESRQMPYLIALPGIRDALPGIREDPKKVQVMNSPLKGGSKNMLIHELLIKY